MFSELLAKLTQLPGKVKAFRAACDSNSAPALAADKALAAIRLVCGRRCAALYCSSFSESLLEGTVGEVLRVIETRGQLASALRSIVSFTLCSLSLSQRLLRSPASPPRSCRAIVPRLSLNCCLDGTLFGSST